VIQKNVNWLEMTHGANTGPWDTQETATQKQFSSAIIRVEFIPVDAGFDQQRQCDGTRQLAIFSSLAGMRLKVTRTDSWIIEITLPEKSGKLRSLSGRSSHRRPFFPACGDASAREAMC
jgi:hypothetical protein